MISTSLVSKKVISDSQIMYIFQKRNYQELLMNLDINCERQESEMTLRLLICCGLN